MATILTYLRVSTCDQSLGIEAQRSQILQYLTKKGFTVSQEYVDIGISGATAIADRPFLLKLVGDLRTIRPVAVVASCRDRFSRDAGIVAMLEYECRRSGAALLTADGASDGTDPTSVLTRRVLDAIAEHERALIRARTKAALRAKRARGEPAGHAPYGWRTEGGRLVPDDHERRVIAIARSAPSVVDAVREINGAGLRSRSGRCFHYTQIKRLTERTECQSQVHNDATGDGATLGRATGDGGPCDP